MDPNTQQPMNNDARPSQENQQYSQPTNEQVLSPQPTPQVFGPQQSVPSYTSVGQPAVPAQPVHSADPVSSSPFGTPAVPQQPAPVTVMSPFGPQQSYQGTPQAAQGIGMPYQPQPQKGARKRLVLASAVGLGVLLVGSSTAAYFGYLVPNKPENLWATALKRTGDGYDKLISYSDQNKDAKSATFKGDIKLSGSFATDGTLEGQADAKNAVFKGDIGIVTSRLNVETRVIDVANSENPDIYVKASGLKGLDSMIGTGTMLNSFDNQWVVIDHTFLDNTQKAALDEGGLSGISGADVSQLTPDETTQIAKAVGEVNKQYLFTTDDSKAVLRMVKSVGKEKQDDRDVYHYVVGLDKQHTKDYLNALATRLDSTPLKKMLSGKSVKDAVQLDDLLKEVDKYNDGDTADVWVDSKMKLVRTVRFTDKKTPTDYLELGLHYTGGDSIPFVLKFHAEEDGQLGTVNASVTVNTKTNVTDLAFDFDVVMDKESKQHETGKGTLSITPSSNAIKVDKPASAKSLQELIGTFYGGSTGAGSSSRGGARLGGIEI